VPRILTPGSASTRRTSEPEHAAEPTNTRTHGRRTWPKKLPPDSALKVALNACHPTSVFRVFRGQPNFSRPNKTSCPT
jgi:hypothetical protein